MPTSTALDLITASLRKIGVHAAGEAVEADEAFDALDELNRLLETWSAQRRLVYTRQNAVRTLTPGQAAYTLGPGGDIVAPVRPFALREAHVRIGTIDFPVEIIEADQYALISLKTLQTTWPVVAYYEPAYPLGVLTLYPVPSATGALSVGMDSQFAALQATTDTLSFPPGYKDALVHALGKRLAPEYGKTLAQEFLDDWRRCEGALAKQNHRAVIAQTDPRLPGAGVTDPNWIMHGGYR